MKVCPEKSSDDQCIQKSCGTGTYSLLWSNLSHGSRLLIALAVLSSLGVLFWPLTPPDGLEIWIFSRNHQNLYQPKIEQWNESNPEKKAYLSLLSTSAMERRLLSGFFSGSLTTGLVEIEVNNAPRFFAGPLDAIGLLDLTDRIREEGIDQMILPASFSPWTTRGRIMGLPHDVHPVMLAYRHDLVEAAGIDLSGVETWDDFFHAMRPLMKDNNRDGKPDRYLLSFSLTDAATITALLLQAGGAVFDENENPTLNRPLHAQVLSKLVAWSDGPERVTVEAAEFSASGNRLKIEGFVVASLMPDWLCNTWKTDLPQLSGKYRLMPLPAWDAGGLRTTVSGGTMMGIPRINRDTETAWQVAKYLYLSQETAEQLYLNADIITPVSKHWDNPVFDRPSEYFGGQIKGRLYIEQAAHVPRRSSSPFLPVARARLADAALALRAYARSHNNFDPSFLESEAERLLTLAQEAVMLQMNRNVFLGDAENNQ
jgi:arabinosaccharide transport system substrate-binding protein